ncbi:unnamed protein product [Caenorhabditis auriculariae]|uniref:Uncharacterized protein n=1 Tax=Caenorhabditis auriculariae TaxID=2777116 RepID=A0A8S1HRS3_9PELO|nr:unnamed protein product [Caenorhabditis auriculariae]
MHSCEAYLSGVSAKPTTLRDDYRGKTCLPGHLPPESLTSYSLRPNRTSHAYGHLVCEVFNKCQMPYAGMCRPEARKTDTRGEKWSTFTKEHLKLFQLFRGKTGSSPHHAILSGRPCPRGHTGNGSMHTESFERTSDQNRLWAMRNQGAISNAIMLKSLRDSNQVQRPQSPPVDVAVQQARK